MSRLFSNIVKTPLFAVADGSGTAIEDKALSKEDTIKFLGEDEPDEDKEVIDIEDKKKEKDKKDDRKDKKDDKDINRKEDDKEDDKDIEGDDEDKEDDEDEDLDDELKDIEEDLEEPGEEKLELVTPVRRKDILKKYPKLFEDFPYLEKAYYREQQFTEIFPTINDAKEAQSNSDTLSKIEQDLFSGKTENMLLAVKEEPKAFAKLVDDYLPTLARVDEKAYHHVIGNTIKQTIVSMVQEARRSGNEALQNSAAILNQFVFGSSDFVPPAKLAVDETESKPDPEKTKFENERKEYVQQRFTEAKDTLNTKINNSIRATIEANIDPKGSMSDYVRRSAVRECLESIDDLIKKDGRFKTINDRLWEKAFKENFSKPSLDTIKSAHFSKAKTLLPSVIKKARNEALRGIGKRPKDDVVDDTDDKDTDKKPRESRKTDSPQSNLRSGKIRKASDIPRGMKTLDALNLMD